MIIQHLFYYFRDTFTTKQTKNILELQTNKYKTIVEELVKQTHHHSKEPFFVPNEDIPNVDIPNVDMFYREPDAISDTESVIDYTAMETNLDSWVKTLV